MSPRKSEHDPGCQCKQPVLHAPTIVNWATLPFPPHCVSLKCWSSEPKRSPFLQVVLVQRRHKICLSPSLEILVGFLPAPFPKFQEESSSTGQSTDAIHNQIPSPCFLRPLLSYSVPTSPVPAGWGCRGYWIWMASRLSCEHGVEQKASLQKMVPMYAITIHLRIAASPKKTVPIYTITIHLGIAASPRRQSLCTQ